MAQPQPSLSTDDKDHISVLMESFRLFREKNAVRGDLWKQFPPSDKIRELRERVLRIETAARIMNGAQGDLIVQRELAAEAIVEDALDIINFAVFLIRQVREGECG